MKLKNCITECYLNGENKIIVAQNNNFIARFLYKFFKIKPRIEVLIMRKSLITSGYWYNRYNKSVKDEGVASAIWGHDFKLNRVKDWDQFELSKKEYEIKQIIK